MKNKLTRVEPKLDQLLPTPQLRTAYEDASAALEAGRAVRAARKKAGLTQSTLARRLFMKQARVSAIEAGKGRDGPSYGLLKRIAAACDMSVVSMFAYFSSSEARGGSTAIGVTGVSSETAIGVTGAGSEQNARLNRQG